MADELGTGGSDLGGGAPAGDTPSFIELTDTSLIKAPGMDKPVPYKDYFSGYVPKSDLTRMRQQDATTLANERATLQREQANVQRAAQQLTQRLGPQNGQPAADPFAELAAAPYIDGKTFAGTMKSLLQAVQANNQQQAATIEALHTRLNRAEQGYSSLQGRTRQADVSSMFDATRSKLGLPDNPEVRSLIESEYHAHDGWDTVSREDAIEHLSNVVKQRYEGLQTVWRTAQQQRVDEARKRPAFPPAGNGQPRLKPGVRGIGSMPAEQLADNLWQTMQANRADS